MTQTNAVQNHLTNLFQNRPAFLKSASDETLAFLDDGITEWLTQQGVNVEAELRKRSGGPAKPSFNIEEFRAELSGFLRNFRNNKLG